MDAVTRQLIERLHNAPYRCVLALAGGGAGAAAGLLNVPGGSRTVLAINIPYHPEALAQYLGSRPEQFCSAATARAMAARAYERAGWLTPGEAGIGLGCTASLATDRPKRGGHRIHLGVHNAGRVASYSLDLSKGARDRSGEEAVLDALLLNALAEACGVAERIDPALLSDESLQVELSLASDPLARLLRAEIAAVRVDTDGRQDDKAATPSLLLPGAFNPVHEGHRRLAETAAGLLGTEAAFELSVVNVDKPELRTEEVRRRLSQFQWHAPVWLTRAPTFREKALHFPNVVFVVGADTANRIVAPRYYGDDDKQMSDALAQIRAQGCRFLVAPRVDSTGHCVGLDEVTMPPAYRDLFTAIPEKEFRVDLSSTVLRSTTSS